MSRVSTHWVAVAVAICTLAAPTLAAAQICEGPGIQSELQYLRRLSLDLRGRLPSATEMKKVIEDGQVDPDTVDDMIASEDFSHQIRTYHKDLLWSNLSSQRLAQNNFIVSLPRNQSQARIFSVVSNIRRTTYRGANTTCKDEPARFGEDGEILYDEEEDRNGVMIRREGWVEVNPYWAPDTTIKVCAFDAQTAEEGTARNGRPAPCKQMSSADCGCGPNLNWCLTREVQSTITESMTEQVLDSIDQIVTQDRPYTEVILGGDFRVNGPLVHYYSYLTSVGNNLLSALPDPGYVLPNLAFSDAQWVPVSANTPLHSGILTLPGFLLKLQSNRGRANRFYNAFLCKAFEAPEGGLPAADDPCNEEPDLSKRCGCSHCHAGVEPAAAHWGRWSEAGMAPMATEEFPRFRDICDSSNNPGASRNFLCRRFYLTEANHPSEEKYVGHLLSYLFADEHEGRDEAIESGPSLLAGQAVDNGAFAKCTAEKVWNLFLAHPPSTKEAGIIAEMTADFEAGYSFRDLVRAAVTHPKYVYAGLYNGSEEN